MSGHHSDQISEESEVSKVTLCVQILNFRLKWHCSASTHELSQSFSKGRYKAARAAESYRIRIERDVDVEDKRIEGERAPGQVAPEVMNCFRRQEG